MGPRAGWLAVIGALCAAAPTAAQDQPPPGSDESETTIVVTGETEQPTSSETYEQAREVSRVGRYQLYEEALPRFETPLCPGVFGLRDDYAAEIVARIRANAARLELLVGDDDCSPNLVVAFLDDGQSFFTEFGRKHPALFQTVSAAELDELLHEPAPVRVWNNIALRWTGASDPPPGWPKARPSVRGQLSRNFMPEAKDIVASLVLFERAEVVGMTLTQLADYATMRGVSNTRPASGDQPLSTILALFEGDRTDPEELTSFDIGYLRSLYLWQSNLSAASRFVKIAGRAEEAREEEGAR